MDCMELFNPEDYLLDDELEDIDLAIEDIMIDSGSDIDNIGNITDDLVDSIDYDVEDDLEDYTDEDYIEEDDEDSDIIEYEVIEDDSEEDVRDDIADIEIAASDE